MELYILLGAWCVVVFFLTWRKFLYGLGILITILPTYLIRFKFGPLPSTLLELTFEVIFLVWIIKYAKQDCKEIIQVIKKHALFFILLFIFFVASFLGVIVSDMVLLSLGQWRAYFLEPLLLFFVLLGRRKYVSKEEIFLILGFSTLSISIYGLFQQFTGYGIATPEWTNPETRRVTAFFSSPNAIGLFLGPIMILLTYFIFKNVSSGNQLIQKIKNDRKSQYSLLLLTLSFLVVLCTKSEGTLAALGAGGITVLFLIGFRKIAIGVTILALVVSFSIPKLHSAVLFQDKAGQNRLVLWSYSWEFLSHSPKNFFLGAGVRQFFRKIQKPYYDVKKLERLIYPHNIVLNFWTEIGFFGMISFFGMYIYLFLQGLKQKKDLKAVLVGALVVILVHGLVDVPYFKNDLALLFWIVASLFFYENY